MRLQEAYDLWKAKENVDTEKLSRIDFDKVA
jgi:plasmid maintenance system antidote protein VapI